MINNTSITTEIYSDILFFHNNNSTSIFGEMDKHEHLDRKDKKFIGIQNHQELGKSILPIIGTSSLNREEEIENSSIPEFFNKDLSKGSIEDIELAKAMLLYDSIGNMQPKKSQKITIKIKKISKGKLPTYEPDY